jgi:phage terminase large subunit-like protein
MNILVMREIFLKHKQDPNYHFRDLTDKEFEEKATASYNKLSADQIIMTKKSWSKQLATEGLWSEDKKDVLLQELKNLRFLAQTNLYFLCKLLNYYLTVDTTHEDICNEFFTRKDPTIKNFKTFADNYVGLKKRMLLVPRGGFKSTINMADCVQYLICYPEIRMLILTGTLDLAEAFVGEVRGHFEQEQDSEVDAKGKPTYRWKMLQDEDGDWFTSQFQVLFPEHCIKPGTGSAFEYKTPASSGGPKEKSLEAGGIEQTLSGFHYDIMKLDDVVTNENSTTPDRIIKINKQIAVNRGMLNPYGFYDVIGTWYDEADYYGITLANEEKMANAKGLKANIKGSVDSGIFNSRVQMNCYLRSAWRVKEESKFKPEMELGAADYDYWFPERLTYEVLKGELEEDAWGFAIKYMNNPRLIGKVRFPRELLIKRTIPSTQLPAQGKIVTVVDTAYSTKSWADYTVIMTALIYGGRFYIINMKRGRWNEYDLPKQIASVAYQWKPSRVSIEESVGVAWLVRGVREEMSKHQISVPIDLVTLGKGSKKTAKAQKAKPVIRLMNDERIFILMSCEGKDEIYEELSLFTGTKEDTHDDIVSAISLLVDQYGAYANMDASMPRQHFVADNLTRARHDMIHGLGRYAAQADDNPATAYQVETMQQNRAFVETESDPLSDAGLF